MELVVGTSITLKVDTISTQKATIVERGNTFVVVEHGGRRERIALRDAHHRIKGFEPLSWKKEEE